MGSVVAFLWWGSKPVIGADRRIVCTFSGKNFFSSHNQSIQVGDRISICDYTNAANNIDLDFREVISPVVVTGTEWYEPNRVLKYMADQFPILYRSSLIRSRAEGGWKLHFSLTPLEWEVVVYRPVSTQLAS